MKERLLQIIDLEQLTPSKFADIIGVQRSSVSHIISGRNKPSFDFLQKTLKAFPGLNADWLIMGEGTMYERMGREVSGNLFDPPLQGNEPSSVGHIAGDEQLPGQISDSDKRFSDTGISDTAMLRNGNLEDSVDASGKPGENTERKTSAELGTDYVKEEKTGGKPTLEGVKKIVQVMVFYTDDTFRSFGPSQ